MEDKISILNDLYAVIDEAESAIDSLATWQTTSDGHASIRNRRFAVSRARKAYDLLKTVLDDSKYCGCKLNEHEAETPPDNCYCNVGNAPCGWCTNPDNDPDKASNHE